VSSSATPGTVVFGHDTGVSEDYARDFTLWSGTGTVSGTGDGERLIIGVGQYEDSPAWNLGVGDARIRTDVYDTGSGPSTTIQYKTGATQATCEADSWNTYNGTSFSGLGWVKVRMNL
jgi:hypothetical protein